MTSHVSTVAFQGIEAVPVDVQAHFLSGQVQFTIVGLGDKAVAESRERVSICVRSQASFGGLGCHVRSSAMSVLASTMSLRATAMSTCLAAFPLAISR